MIKAKILPKSPRDLKSNSNDAENVEISIVFWSKLMNSTRRNPISLPPNPSSALSHHAHFQTISNVKSTTFFKYTGTGLTTT